MNKDDSLSNPIRSNKHIFLRITCLSLALLFLFLGNISENAQAAWDGTGSGTGATGITQITGNFSIDHASVQDIIGYRFSIYNESGSKIGHSVDINFESYSSALYRSYKDSKQSHIDLNRTYQTTGTASLGTLSTDNTTASYVYLDTSLPSTPTDVESWLNPSRATDIADMCQAYSYGTSTSYIICEPLFVAKLDGPFYAMTMAEYAVYQSTQIGWGHGSNFVSGTYMYNISRFTSAAWGRYLYATGTYPALGTTAVPSSAVKNDYKGTPSVLLSSEKQGHNSAADILKYQVGMAVYTDVIPLKVIDLNGYLDGSNETHISPYGTCDIYINGTRVANNVQDFYKFYPVGSTYEIKDIKTAAGKSFGGYRAGGASGVLTYDTDVRLIFNTAAHSLTINPNGGVYNGSSSVATTSKKYGETVSVNAPTRTGYYFNGWSWSSSKSFGLVQPTIGYAYSNGTVAGTYSQAINDTEGYANHKWTGISASSDAWNCITLSNYSVSAGETVTISGWIRINSNTPGVNLNFYHGAKINDYQNSKYSVANTNGEWQYFSFSRTFADAATAYLQVYTGTLKGKSGNIDFDLKGISIQRGDGSIVPTTLTMPDASVTLTAKWTPITYTVNYNGNGANSGSVPTQNVGFGSSVVVLPNGFDREGYVFVGWNTKPDGTGDLYAPETSISPSRDLTLYAQWEEVVEEPGISGYLRFIALPYLETIPTLEENSKWKGEALYDLLKDTLSNDFSDTSSCNQVWYFPAESDPENGYKSYEEVHEWCQARGKGSQTNRDFLSEFEASNKTASK